MQQLLQGNKGYAAGGNTEFSTPMGIGKFLPVGIFGRIVFGSGIGDLGAGDALQGERDTGDKLAEAERFVLIDCQCKRLSANGAGMGFQHGQKLGKNVGKFRPEAGRRERLAISPKSIISRTTGTGAIRFLPSNVDPLTIFNDIPPKSPIRISPR
jgi:hypothetical protein